MTRRLTALTLLLVACQPVEVNEHRTGGTAPSIGVKAYWEDEGGETILVGGVFCQLFRGDDAEPLAWGVTQGLEPLVFPDLEAGDYRLVVQGRDGLELGKELYLPPRRRLTVRIDVEASRRGERAARDEALVRRVIFVDGDGDEEQVDLLEPDRLEIAAQVHATSAAPGE